MTSAKVFSRSICRAITAGLLGFGSLFCISYGFFQMIAVAIDSETAHKFAIAAGIFAGGFGMASGFGITAKAATKTD